MNRVLSLLAGLALAAGCGSGGGAVGSTGGGDTGGITTSPQQQQRLVVQFDQNGDDEPDLVTLDTTETPFKILEVLEGVSGGTMRDVTATAAGQTLDTEISNAISGYIANSYNVGKRSELDVTNQQGQSMTLVIFE